MALKRYSIWDKKSDVITPSGEVFTAEQWKDRYPLARRSEAIIVGSAGLINGAFFGELNSMVTDYEANGSDFSDCKTPEEKLEKIEKIDEDRWKQSALLAAQPSNEQRIADALEKIVELLSAKSK